jgi:hypothetical protein
MRTRHCDEALQTEFEVAAVSTTVDDTGFVRWEEVRRVCEVFGQLVVARVGQAVVWWSIGRLKIRPTDVCQVFLGSTFRLALIRLPKFTVSNSVVASRA